MRHLFYLHNLPLPDKVAAQKKKKNKIKNKIPARLYIYFPYGEISNYINNINWTFVELPSLAKVEILLRNKKWNVF